MNLVKTYIDKDNYGGIGLFAAQYIAKGQCIWDFNHMVDKQWDSDDFHSLLNTLSYIEKHYLLRYTSEKDGIVYFYGDDAKYCNHSKTPNTHGYPNQYASVDIQIGQEITCDYSVINDEFSEGEFETLNGYKPINKQPIDLGTTIIM